MFDKNAKKRPLSQCLNRNTVTVKVSTDMSNNILIILIIIVMVGSYIAQIVCILMSVFLCGLGRKTIFNDGLFSDTMSRDLSKFTA